MSDTPISSPIALPPEPPEAFHCIPPSEETRRNYPHILGLSTPLPVRWSKLLFDKTLALIALAVLSPLIGLLYLANLVEGWLIPEHRGPFVYSYIAGSAGQKFRKHKIRQIKMSEIDPDLAAAGSWHAYAREWSPQSRTYLGRLVKALYLDELPQLWDILRGDMSFVGPRPLAWHHFERDLAQGNVTRLLLRGGLLGRGQAQKGTAALGDPQGDFNYVDAYVTRGPLALIWLDLRIMFAGVSVVFRTRGA